jgi:ABC-type Fe3+/spermidine/putrescine transport system ATPase subunit
VHIVAADAEAILRADVESSARVKNRIFLGQQTEYLVEADGLGDILVLASKHAESVTGGFSPGDVVRVGWDDTSTLVFEEVFDRGRTTVGSTSEIDHDGVSEAGE